MLHQLPELPFEKDALEPFLSSETLDYHHGKHHKAYVDNLNKLIEGTEHENKTLEDIILTSSGGIFNNSAQHWNHSFYWNCLSPNGGSKPSSELISILKSTFGSFDEFKDQANSKPVYRNKGEANKTYRNVLTEQRKIYQALLHVLDLLTDFLTNFPNNRFLWVT